MKRTFARNCTVAIAFILFPSFVHAQDEPHLLPPATSLAFNGTGCGGGCCYSGERPFHFLWTGFEASHEYDIYGHRRFAIRTAPKCGIQVEGLLNRKYKGCRSCINEPDPCGCNSCCTTSLLDAIGYMRRNNCAGCCPQCTCPKCSGHHSSSGGSHPGGHSGGTVAPVKSTPTPAQQPQGVARPTVPTNTVPVPVQPAIPPAPAPPKVIVKSDPAPQEIVAPTPTESSSEDDIHFDDPPEPNSDVLDLAPTPNIPQNEIPQNVIPLRSSRRHDQNRTLSAVRRYIRT